MRFNPADPGLYGCLFDVEKKLASLEAELVEKSKTADSKALLELMNEADAKAKALLDEVFGGENDFQKALGGISLLADCGNGKTLAQNLFIALSKVLEQGAARLVSGKIATAREQL